MSLGKESTLCCSTHHCEFFPLLDALLQTVQPSRPEPKTSSFIGKRLFYGNCSSPPVLGPQLTPRSRLSASGVTGLLFSGMTGLGTLYVNMIGRRTLILWGGVCVVTCHICIGSLCTHAARPCPPGDAADCLKSFLKLRCLWSRVYTCGKMGRGGFIELL